MILILAMGSMEAASMIFLRQALVQASYESVKEAIKLRGSQALAITRAEQVLSFRDIEGQTITFNPANVADLPKGTPVTVTVTAPGDANSVLPFGPFKNRTISASATMLKE